MSFEHFGAFIILVFCFDVAIAERRISGGSVVFKDKPFMVYFLSSNLTKTYHDSWLCGGSIISTRKILTSAACLVEMNNLYVIAGYKKYVNHLDIDNDPCTRDRKQKVIQICVPKAYTFGYDDPTTWSYLDIGVALVEKPYDFKDISYRLYCSYTPAPIRINYESKFQANETDVVTFGWGMKAGRQPHNIIDENSKLLHSAPSIIVDKSVCKASFTNMDAMIDKYMLCTNGSGVLDAEGNIIQIGDTILMTCRRQFNSSFTSQCIHDILRNYTMNANKSETLKTRRDMGLCQNDHGGPLVTWVGTEPTVIAVAMAPVYKSNYECVGPYLFTSTHCCGKILQCMLMLEPVTSHFRRKCTEEIKIEGIEIQTSSVQWNDNVDTQKVSGLFDTYFDQI